MQTENAKFPSSLFLLLLLAAPHAAPKHSQVHGHKINAKGPCSLKLDWWRQKKGTVSFKALGGSLSTVPEPANVLLHATEYRSCISELNNTRTPKQLAKTIKRYTTRLKELSKKIPMTPSLRIYAHAQMPLKMLEHALIHAFGQIAGEHYRAALKRLLPASPKSVLQKALLWLQFQQLVQSFIDMLQIMGVPYNARKLHCILSLYNREVPEALYWSLVHFRALKNGLRLVFKIACLYLVNHAILPLLVAQLSQTLNGLIPGIGNITKHATVTIS
ncbi:hypothetical protein BdWA1_000949 [Babesia duncani]|uniref:Uncharacterized protein n=1 Tax=Babesia duncani TaxID=323732 RepID=A0AAD9PNR5_9APIC|nr:hypothetical protein BdWA1_000949 [Babesia duncani]